MYQNKISRTEAIHVHSSTTRLIFTIKFYQLISKNQRVIFLNFSILKTS